MTDRELLELAAKAAGISILRSRLDDPMWRNMLLVERHPNHPGQGVGWNPLTDDGDALRLASVLELDIMHRVVGGTRVEILPAGGPLTQEFYVGSSVRLAATRRAIVRAVAEIGRATPIQPSTKEKA